jgi:hypothetical protein
MNKQSWDESIARFLQAVLLVPENVLYRQSLRGCEFKKFGDDPTQAGLQASELARLLERIAEARVESDWAAMDEIAESGLKSDPWNPALNAALAEACERRGFAECATFAHHLARRGEQGEL